MADGPALALQKGLVDGIKATPAVNNAVEGRVYDQPPDKAPLPFVRVGDIEVRPLRTDGVVTSWLATFTLEVHSRPVAGRVEAARISERLVALLDEHPEALPVVGYRLPWLEFVTEALTREGDGKTYRARIVFDTALEPL